MNMSFTQNQPGHNPRIRGFTSASDAEAKPRRGFTLIETLVAISVLILSLTGPLSIASNALKSAYYARDEVIASYLAQEGLEYVRAVRDQNRIASPQQSWLTNLVQCVNANCTVDFVNFTPPAVCSGACAPLLIANPGGLYNQAAGDQARFTRTLTMTLISSTEVNVKVSVSWVSQSATHSVTSGENLFQWI
jgi:Tfp pilus assembly protein PilV